MRLGMRCRTHIRLTSQFNYVKVAEDYECQLQVGHGHGNGFLIVCIRCFHVTPLNVYVQTDAISF